MSNNNKYHYNSDSNSNSNNNNRINKFVNSLITLGIMSGISLLIYRWNKTRLIEQEFYNKQKQLHCEFIKNQYYNYPFTHTNKTNTNYNKQNINNNSYDSATRARA